MTPTENQRGLAGLLRENLYFDLPLRVGNHSARLRALSETERTARECDRVATVQFSKSTPKPGPHTVQGHSLRGHFEFQADLSIAGTAGRFTLPALHRAQSGGHRPTRGEQIWSLMLRCGAMSDAFAMHMAPQRERSLENLNNEIPNPHSLRLLQHHEGDLVAHCSYFRLQPDLWVGCDLASLAGAPATMAFFSAGVRTLLSRAGEEDYRVWFCATAGHPFWREFLEWLRTQSLANIRTVFYVRTLVSERAPVLALREILPGSPVAGVPDEPQLCLLGIRNGVFDWQRGAGLFPSDRRLFEFQHAGKRFLFSFADSPTGLNLTRQTDSGWLMPLDAGAQIDWTLVRAVVASAQQNLPTNSSIAAVRILHRPDSILEDGLCGAPMESILFPPAAMKYFFP